MADRPDYLDEARTLTRRIEHSPLTSDLQRHLEYAHDAGRRDGVERSIELVKEYAGDQKWVALLVAKLGEGLE